MNAAPRVRTREGSSRGKRRIPLAHGATSPRAPTKGGVTHELIQNSQGGIPAKWSIVYGAREVWYEEWYEGWYEGWYGGVVRWDGMMGWYRAENTVRKGSKLMSHKDVEVAVHRSIPEQPGPAQRRQSGLPPGRRKREWGMRGEGSAGG